MKWEIILIPSRLEILGWNGRTPRANHFYFSFAIIVSYAMPLSQTMRYLSVNIISVARNNFFYVIKRYCFCCNWNCYKMHILVLPSSTLSISLFCALLYQIIRSANIFNILFELPYRISLNIIRDIQHTDFYLSYLSYVAYSS